MHLIGNLIAKASAVMIHAYFFIYLAKFINKLELGNFVLLYSITLFSAVLLTKGRDIAIIRLISKRKECDKYKFGFNAWSILNKKQYFLIMIITCYFYYFTTGATEITNYILIVVLQLAFYVINLSVAIEKGEGRYLNANIIESAIIPLSSILAIMFITHNANIMDFSLEAIVYCMIGSLLVVIIFLTLKYSLLNRRKCYEKRIDLVGKGFLISNVVGKSLPHLPILIIGIILNAGVAAEFKIIQQLLLVIQMIVVSVGNYIIPFIQYEYKTDKIKFNKRYTNLSIFALMLVLSYTLLFYILGEDILYFINEEYVSLKHLIDLTLLLMSFSVIFGPIQILSEQLGMYDELKNISLLNFFTTSILLILLAIKYDLLGIVVAVIVSIYLPKLLLFLSYKKSIKHV